MSKISITLTTDQCNDLFSCVCRRHGELESDLSHGFQVDLSVISRLKDLALYISHGVNFAEDLDKPYLSRFMIEFYGKYYPFLQAVEYLPFESDEEV